MRRIDFVSPLQTIAAGDVEDEAVCVQRCSQEVSNPDSLNLIERDLIAGAVVKFGRLRAGMIGYVLAFFEVAAVGPKGGDARSPEFRGHHT